MPERSTSGHGAGLPLEALLRDLRVTGQGLTCDEAARRLALQRSAARVPHAPRTELLTFMREAANPLVVILLFAGAASAFMGQVRDAWIIGVIVCVSIGIDFVQTYRSGRAARKLRDAVAPTATVQRDGEWVEVRRHEVVVGDVVRLSAGDLVPADARLLTATDLHVQQSALTGESLPAEKHAVRGALEAAGPDSPGLVFLGTSVVSGTATAVAVATGRATAFGDIVERLAARPEETEFERGARRFGVLVFQAVVVLVLGILVVHVALGRDAMQSLLFTVALAVGLTPELLPMISTVTLAQGALRMSREKVLVKHLSALQNLGGMDVLCSDKTGTLTTGVASLDASLDAFGNADEHALRLGRLNARFESGIRSPFDTALLQHPSLGEKECSKLDEVPFDFERRRLSVLLEQGGEWRLITKGAPESVLEVCVACESGGRVVPLDSDTRARCREVFEALGARGFRVLAVASRCLPSPRAVTVDDERELTLAGFLAFADHLIEGAAESIERLRRDGVQVKVLTGDSETVTRELCRRVGIDPERIVLGRDLEDLDQPALARVAEQTQVFARVSPSQKHRIVRALRTHGHVVGFLGDGVNDAPSLHGADVGISVAGAVDVAREASDIILLERRLDVLHAGILAGRRASGNVFKFLLMGTSSNFGNMFSMAIAGLFLPFLPMTPTQILLNNLLYDLAQTTIPTDHVDPVYLARPQRWDIGAIRRFMLWAGPVSSLFDLLTFVVLLRVFRFGEAAFQTGWFLESLATQVLVLFVIRTAGRPWSNRPSRPLAVTALAVVAIGALIPYTPPAAWLGMVPLPPQAIAFVFIIVPCYLVMVELLKRRILQRALPGWNGERGPQRSQLESGSWR